VQLARKQILIAIKVYIASHSVRLFLPGYYHGQWNLFNLTVNTKIIELHQGFSTKHLTLFSTKLWE